MAEDWSWYWEREEEPVQSSYFRKIKTELEQQEKDTTSPLQHKQETDVTPLQPKQEVDESQSSSIQDNTTEPQLRSGGKLRRSGIFRRSVRFEEDEINTEKDKSVAPADEALDLGEELEDTKENSDVKFRRSKSFRSHSDKSKSRFERSRSFRLSLGAEEKIVDKDEKPTKPNRSFWTSFSDVNRGRAKPHGGFVDAFKSSLMRTKSSEEFTRRFSRAQSHRLSHIKEFWHNQQEKLNKKLGIRKSGKSA